jgi:hypothetical protein
MKPKNGVKSGTHDATCGDLMPDAMTIGDELTTARDSVEAEEYKM